MPSEKPMPVLPPDLPLFRRSAGLNYHTHETMVAHHEAWRQYAADCEARVRELESDIANYMTVAMAAAVEIQEHWDAHCDAEGYGPANLVRRLEQAFPAQYGYTAKSLIETETRCTELERQLADLTYRYGLMKRRAFELESPEDQAAILKAGEQP